MRCIGQHLSFIEHQEQSLSWLVKAAQQITQLRAGNGGIIDKFMPMSASAVSVWCNGHGGPARIGINLDEQGRKVRVCRKCGAEL